ncbi:RNA polymerase sigma factor [Gemmatimonas sp.]
MEAARRGDPGAVLQLVQACQPDLKRFARRTCANTEDAEDAVQFALWQLYRQIDALRTWPRLRAGHSASSSVSATACSEVPARHKR